MWAYKVNDPHNEARYLHAFLLRLEGLTYAEIAKKLGVCPSRARALDYHGRKLMVSGLKRSMFLKFRLKHARKCPRCAVGMKLIKMKRQWVHFDQFRIVICPIRNIGPVA
jgi:hypothetical protein